MQREISLYYLLKDRADLFEQSLQGYALRVIMDMILRSGQIIKVLDVWLHLRVQSNSHFEGWLRQATDNLQEMLMDKGTETMVSPLPTTKGRGKTEGSLPSKHERRCTLSPYLGGREVKHAVRMRIIL